ncbi:MAG: hydroxypyruvate isomerase family protein [Rhabdaerophilum sp.]
MPRFSANLGFLWPDRPLLKRIDSAARAGFKAVELHWPYDVPAREMRDRMARHDLTLLGINTPVGQHAGDFGLGAWPGREGEFLAGFAEALAYATEAGARAIHVMAGVIPSELAPEARATFLGNLRQILPLAKRSGITLLLEPINRRDKPGYFYDRIEEAAAIIRELGSPALKIMFDCYHVGITEGDVIRRMEEFWPLIGHIQIAAVPSRAEPDEGTLDYAQVFAAIDRLHYAGWVGAEYKPRADTDVGLGWLTR